MSCRPPELRFVPVAPANIMRRSASSQSLGWGSCPCGDMLGGALLVLCFGLRYITVSELREALAAENMLEPGEVERILAEVDTDGVSKVGTRVCPQQARALRAAGFLAPSSAGQRHGIQSRHVAGSKIKANSAVA